jgi:hypothetical protein
MRFFPGYPDLRGIVSQRGTEVNAVMHRNPEYVVTEIVLQKSFLQNDKNTQNVPLSSRIAETIYVVILCDN